MSDKKLYFGINIAHGDCDWTIHEGSPRGPLYTLEEARREYEAGNVDRVTTAFNRLVELNWDLEALKAEFNASLDDLTSKVSNLTMIVKETLEEQRRRQAERN